MPAESASFAAVSDLEMLGIIKDLGGDVQDVPTSVVAVRYFGFDTVKDNKQKCHTSVGSRMAWMRKIGLVIKGKSPSTWKLSPLGEQLLVNRLPKWRSDALVGGAEYSLHLADEVGKTLFHSGDAFLAMERQIRHFVLLRKKG